MDNRPIGVFDSGVGGLTVASEMLALLPHEEICYFGDTKRAPYGGLSKETLTNYTRQIAAFMMKKNVKALMVACNTTSATCLDTLIREFPVPIIGMVEPGVLATLEVAKKSVCLLATQATVSSGMHRRLIQEKNSALTVYAQACVSFVPLVEAGLCDTEAAYAAAKEYLSPFDDCALDTVILGCTHYPLMEKAIRQAAGDGVTIVNPANKAVMILQETLAGRHLLCDSSRTPRHHIYVSGNAQNCDTILKQLFGHTLKAETIAL